MDGRDTPRSRGRYADDGDDRIFRQATDDERRRVYSDRSGSESGHRRGHFDFISMALDMARPHSDDPEAMPIRPPGSPVPGESQVSDEFEGRPQGPGTMVLVPGGIRADPLVLRIQVSLMSTRSGSSQTSDTMIC